MITMKIEFFDNDYIVDVVLSKDGDQWCILAGDNLQVGIAGFGVTIESAISAFRANFRKCEG